MQLPADDSPQWYSHGVNVCQGRDAEADRQVVEDAYFDVLALRDKEGKKLFPTESAAWEETCKRIPIRSVPGKTFGPLEKETDVRKGNRKVQESVLPIEPVIIILISQIALFCFVYLLCI